MSILYKLFKQDPSSREGIVTTVSGLGVIVNIVIAASKVLIGLLTSSIAIMSEGVNNAADALTAILTLLGAKFAGKHPDEKHPFGYGRIEYLTSLVIAAIILVSGFTMFKDSINLIIHPEEMSVSYMTLIIIACTAVIKFFLGVYTIKKGKEVRSGSLIGVGLEGRNDAFISIITIVSALVYLVFHISIDAWAGAVMSLLIIKAGVDVLLETASELIGRPGKKELATTLYKEIRSTPGIINAVDMILHNYGPDRFSGSVNVEIDHEKTIGEAYEIIHALQLKIMHEYNVVMVFGMYAVDNDHEEVRDIREYIAKFVRAHEHTKSYHALYLEPGTDKIYVDFIVDYKERDWDKLRENFKEYMKVKYPENEIVLTIETEYV